MPKNEIEVYFDGVASLWQRHSSGLSSIFSGNAPQERRRLSLTRALAVAPGKALELGCGTGELACDLAESGFAVTAVDFSSEMLRLAKQGASVKGLTTINWIRRSAAQFVDDGNYDAIFASGLIEYLEADELPALIRNCRRLASPQALLMVSSRNRLFNAFSANKFTEVEKSLGAFDSLVAESTEILHSTSQQDCLRRLLVRRSSPPASHCYPITGVPLGSRKQFTPTELVGLFHREGWEATELLPIHYHPQSSIAAEGFPAAGITASDAFGWVERNSDSSRRLVPFSSSFLLIARRMA